MGGETVRIGFIGAGVISEYHIAGIAAAGGADMRVISGRKEARVVPVAKRFGIPDVATDYRAVLERDDIDAVVITTPDNTHEEIAVAAGESGKAILLQKPMAFSSAECRRIIGAAKDQGVDLQVSYMHRYFEEVVRARELLGEGKLGQVLAIRLRNATPGPYKAWFFDPAFVAGGVVPQLGSHGIDLAQYMFGDIEWVLGAVDTKVRERVLPDGDRVANIQLEDHGFATYRFVDGPMGSHEMSFSETAGTDRFLLEIYCEKGTLMLRTHRGPLAIYAPGVTGAGGWFVPDLPSRAFGERHHAHWLDIVRGKISSDPTAEDSLAGMLVIEAILESARTGSQAKPDRVERPRYEH